jgi:dihydroorotate dehydrogenase electron transfer subunit
MTVEVSLVFTAFRLFFLSGDRQIEFVGSHKRSADSQYHARNIDPEAEPEPGTEQIAAFTEGMEVDCLGPLGNGFDFGGFDNIILTGGGTGVFPINFAYEELTRQGKNVTVCEGFRDARQVILNKDGYILTTDAGDTGIKGTVIAGLDTIDIKDPANTLVCCVGPIPMMKAVGKWAEDKGMKCLVSMEQRMACGAGICLCCIVKVKDDDPDGYKNVRCCKEGPVFDSTEVVWQ